MYYHGRHVISHQHIIHSARKMLLNTGSFYTAFITYDLQLLYNFSFSIAWPVKVKMLHYIKHLFQVWHSSIQETKLLAQAWYRASLLWNYRTGVGQGCWTMGGQGCSCFSASGTLPHLQEGERGGQYSCNMWHVFLIRTVTSVAVICRMWPNVVTEILVFRPRAWRSKVWILADQDICSLPLCQDNLESPPLLLFSGKWGLTLGVKQ
jgi:hypothetical protein